MSYTLQAIVGAQEVLANSSAEGLAVVDLGCGLVMVPLSREVRLRFDIPNLPLTDGGAEPILPELLAAFCSRLSGRGLVAYLEAELFGGVGIQAHVLFSDGVALGEPVVAPDAINEGLRLLGVQQGPHEDEFAAVGLGRYRDTDGWMRESSWVPDQRYDRVPDVRDGLTRKERVVLYVLHETQKERGDRNVPTAMLWGRVCEHFYISPEELSEMLARLGARRF
jgi:hypothetical protein